MKRVTIAVAAGATVAGVAGIAHAWMQRQPSIALPPPAPAALIPLVVPGFTVLERITGAADATRALPLVLVLHGIDADERQLVPFTDIDIPARLVHIRGPVANGAAGFSYFKPRFAGDKGMFLAAAQDMAARLERALGVIASQRAVSRTLLLGYSQGGHLAWLMATTGRFDVVLPISGALPPGYQPPPSVGRTVLRGVHGDQDKTLPASAGAATFLAFQIAGYKGSLARVRGTHALKTIGRHIKATLSEALAPTPILPPSPGLALLRARFGL